MKILVLGAGVIGVTTAWFLSKSGHEVTVVDRQAAPGLETSFANGGQISVSHAEPWANPSAPLKVLKWLAREDEPLLFRLRPDIRQWLWGLALPARVHAGAQPAQHRADRDARRHRRAERLQHRARPNTLPCLLRRTEQFVSGRKRRGARAVLGRLAPGDALQRSLHPGPRATRTCSSTPATAR
jgi:glycine/D-amino acid oxidase-like deaminating enzyme